MIQFNQDVELEVAVSVSSDGRPICEHQTFTAMTKYKGDIIADDGVGCTLQFDDGSVAVGVPKNFLYIPEKTIDELVDTIMETGMIRKCHGICGGDNCHCAKTGSQRRCCGGKCHH